jgi:hypothetical protein
VEVDLDVDFEVDLDVRLWLGSGLGLGGDMFGSVVILDVGGVLYDLIWCPTRVYARRRAQK